jgi:deoxyribodipyrimidine photo-lyase
MQRSLRAKDNPALNVAIQAGSHLRKPVLVFFRLTPHSYHANLRHYHFLVEALNELAADLRGRRVGFMVQRYPDGGVAQFCAVVRASLVIGDENPLRQAEASRTRVAARLKCHFGRWIRISSCRRGY